MRGNEHVPGGLSGSTEPRFWMEFYAEYDGGCRLVPIILSLVDLSIEGYRKNLKPMFKEYKVEHHTKPKELRY